MREGTEKYDDSAQGGYSYAEKLALAAQGLMDPQEIGLPPDDAGQKRALQEISGDEELKPKLGDFVTFEASVVPIQLRAHWARQDLKVVPSGVTAREWEEEWIKEHKHEWAVQGSLHSGTCHATLQRIYADPIIGFVEMMRQAADLLQAKYEDLKRTDPRPIIYRTDKKVVDSSATKASGKQ
jgi:hypothetical protein